jgi:hypothetical protein
MKKYLSILVAIVSALTMISGLVQVFVPGFVLKVVGAQITPTTTHFFAIVGMFMFLFGGLTLHTVYSASPSRVTILWSAFQKFGASIAVGIGIINGIFSMLAAGVATFDFVSGIILILYLKTLKSDETG